MRKQFSSLILLIAAVLLLILIITPPTTVLAIGRPENPGDQGHSKEKMVGTDVHTTILNTKAEKVSTDGAKGSEKKLLKAALQGVKLQACEGKSKNIVSRSTQLNERVLHMEEVFDSIALGIENHYQTHLLPAGKTLANYDALVAAVQTQKDALAPLLLAVQTDIENFSCTSDNPGQQLTQYRTDMQSVANGLLAYKRAVRNLIVAVATVQSKGDKGTTATGSAQQTSSITPTDTVSLTPTSIVSPTVTTTP